MDDPYKFPIQAADPIRSDYIGGVYVQIVCPECGTKISIMLTGRDPDQTAMTETELLKRWNNIEH